MHTCVCSYLICVGAILLPLVMVSSGCECNNNNLTNDNYIMITLSDLFSNCYVSARYSTFHNSIDTGSLTLESCHCGGYVN